MSILSYALVASLCLPAGAAALAAPRPQAQHEPLQHGTSATAPASRPSTSLVVHNGDQTVSLSLADLQALPQVTVTVFNAHYKLSETYSGPLVSDVLAKAGVALTEASQHGILDSYVRAAGTDGYFVVFSGAELQPGLHKGQTILAIAQSGQPLARTGAFQLIDTLDVKPARWVRNLETLTVVPVAKMAQ